MSSDIIKFRDGGQEGNLIADSKKKLGLNNDSAVIRILLKLGAERIDDFLKEAANVTRPLKYSEIDYFTTSLNIHLKARKREDKAENPKKEA